MHHLPRNKSPHASNSIVPTTVSEIYRKTKTTETTKHECFFSAFAASTRKWKTKIWHLILLPEKFLQFDWLRADVYKLNLKYLHVKITVTMVTANHHIISSHELRKNGGKISRFWNQEIQERKENPENQNTEESTSTWLNVWTSWAENKIFETNLLAYEA